MAVGRVPTILLVEDNPADAGLVHEALEEHGVECDLIVAIDGEKAIRFIDSTDARSGSRPDLIILDLNLPRKTGREVLERIHRDRQSVNAPIIVLTSSNEQRDKDDVRKLGAASYITKPSRLSEFLKLGRIFQEFLAASRPG